MARLRFRHLTDFRLFPDARIADVITEARIRGS